MNLYNALTNDDVIKIGNYIDRYVPSTVRSPSRASLDYILRFWASNKTDLFTLLDNNLILEKEYVYMQNRDDINKKMSDLYHSHEFVDEYRAAAQLLLQNNDMLFSVLNVLSLDCLTDAVYNHRDFEVTINDKVIKIARGMRTMKALQKLAKALDVSMSLFEDYRLEHSRILNDKYIKGKLCLSIHPLDYMTMSDNHSDWSSCMSWQDHGCYCRGTVEMMNSDCVLVAYIKSDNDCNLGGITDKILWNNKKWRQLFIVNREQITSIKSYPYYNADITNGVINWLKELASKNWGSNFGDIDEFENDSYLLYDKYKQYNCYYETNTMYNDFGRTTHHISVDLAEINKREYYDFSVNYSGEEICMWCGELCCDFDEEGDLSCSSCNAHYYCSVCGERIDEEDIYEHDGEIYCYACYEDRIAEDQITGEEFFRDDGIEVALIPNEVVEKCEDNIGLFDAWICSNIIFINYSTLQYLIEDNIIQDYDSFKEVSWGITRYFINTEKIIDKTTIYSSFGVDDFKKYQNYIMKRTEHSSLSFIDLSF